MSVQLDAGGEFEYKEVDGRPGWLVGTNGKNRRYVSPGGKQVSNFEYAGLNRKYLGRDIPEGVIRGLSNKSSKLKRFFSAAQVGQENPEQRQAPPPNQATVADSIEWMNQQQTKVGEDESLLDKIIDIADDLPKSDIPKTRATKNHSSADDVAKTIAQWKLSITGGAARITGIPELRMPAQTIVDTTTEEVWLLDHFDLLGSAPVKVLEKSEVGAHAFNLATAYLQWGMVAYPAVKAKIDNMRADTELKRAQAEAVRRGNVSSFPSQQQAAQQQQEAAAAQQQRAVVNGNQPGINPATGLPWSVGQGPRTNPGTSFFGGQQ